MSCAISECSVCKFSWWLFKCTPSTIENRYKSNSHLGGKVHIWRKITLFSFREQPQYRYIATLLKLVYICVSKGFGYFSRSEKSTKFYIKKKEIPQWIFQSNKLEWIQLNPVSIQKKGSFVYSAKWNITVFSSDGATADTSNKDLWGSDLKTPQYSAGPERAR